MNIEKQRLQEAVNLNIPWRKWGPYLSERQWATVREDYSHDGSVWEYFSHDASRSRAYRWGEDGIGGISDDRQLLCFSLAFWNGKDPILKERLFGLTGHEGNHGEDVKECYFYLDNTPTHSYMRMLYRYPVGLYPYEMLLRGNRIRDSRLPEFELADTGIFNDHRYFDIFIEYAKNNADDLLVRVTAYNRCTQESALDIIPLIWFRNTWSWGYDDYKPQLRKFKPGVIYIDHKELGEHYLCAEDDAEMLFCDNNTNTLKLFGVAGRDKYFKDGINDYAVHGDEKAINPAGEGTRAAVRHHLDLKGGERRSIRLRLASSPGEEPFKDFDRIFDSRIAEANEFYNELQAGNNPELNNIFRQAVAGLLWNKQFYYYDIPQWLKGDPAQPAPPVERVTGRNNDWMHLNNADILSMPDKWEYPWYASWDLAFHCVSLAMADAEFAKGQLKLLTREWYMHPNGQLPACEWSFSDVNPPVHAWAAWRVYEIDKKVNNKPGDTGFLEAVFHKLLLNFTWWVNRKDEHNHNIFQGGFLGLDNIGLFDRSAEIPGGGHIEQSDATAWMAMYSLNLMRISLELSKTNPVYQDLATKFLEHFLYIAGAMTNIGRQGIDLWDNDDEFFYDVLQTQNSITRLKVRSLVGLIPLFAVEVLEPDIITSCPEFAERMDWFLTYRPDLAGLVSRWNVGGKGERRLFSLLRGHRLKRILKRMLDTTEFLSDFGVRSLSKFHESNPYTLKLENCEYKVDYEPAESRTGLFGGNSNWRGPVWFPVNFLIIESLLRFHQYYGDDFKVECPTNSGNYVTLKEVAAELKSRLIKIFLSNEAVSRLNNNKDTDFRDAPCHDNYILFCEYFDGDNGKGLGASHQTGWTALVANLIHSDP